MSINSKQLATDEDLERFWNNPLGRSHLTCNYADVPAQNLTDFVAYCFERSYKILHDCVDDDGEPTVADYHVYRIREQFLETLANYTDGFVDSPDALVGKAIGVGEADSGPNLFAVWSVAETVRGNDIVFTFTISGSEKKTCTARLDWRALTPLPTATNATLPDQLKSFAKLNNTIYMIVKLWRLASLCRHSALEAVSRVLLTTIDVLGDQYNDIDLFARHAAMFHEIQNKARQSSLLRLRDESR